jgi:excisionase family DNA binding protein
MSGRQLHEYAFHWRTCLSRPRSNPSRGASKPDQASAATRRSEFLTPTEVADRLLIAPVTVRLWASKGLLPSVTTPGGHRRFRTQDVDGFIARHRKTPRSPGARPSRILIIDDDAQFARFLSKLVASRASDVLVDVAHDGFSAGIKCESLRPDVLTLDLQMPDMNGFEVCAMLRTQFGTNNLRIVALTGFPSRNNVQQILAAGADVCLGKTSPSETLLTELGLARTKKAQKRRVRRE